MSSAPCSPSVIDEAERLARLRGLVMLDTPREEDFDKLMAQLAHRLGIDNVAFALVDADRVWFKARSGTIRRQVTRADSFCTHTIAQREPLVVEDALHDPRFRDSPHVQAQARLRGYAGVPLLLDGIVAIGTVCALVPQPHRFSDRDRAALWLTARAILARIAIQQEVRAFGQPQRDRTDSPDPAPSRPSATAWQATRIAPACVSACV